jgi:TP901 family phage tail tape measure protein
MAIKLFELGFVLKAIDGGMTGALTKAAAQIEAINGAVKNSQPMREAAANLGMIGGASIAAGAAVAYGLKSMVDAAADVDHTMHYLSTNLDAGIAGTREYAQAQQFAEQMSVKFNYAQSDIIDNLYRSKSFLGDWNTALAVTQASLAVAKGSMGDAATVGQQLATVFNDFGDKTKAVNPQISHFADMMAYISRNGAFHDVNELNAALGMSIGAAKAAGMSYADTLATLNAFQAVGIANPGEALEESLQAFARGKLQKDLGVALATTAAGGLDVIGTFVNLRKEMGAGTITVQKFQEAAAALGIRGERALTAPIDQMVAMQKALTNPAQVNGAALQGALTMLQSFDEQMGILGKKWDAFKESGGQQLLNPLISLAHGFGAILTAMTGFAKAHPMITKFVVTFAAIGATLAIVVGGLVAMAGGLLAAASFIPAGGMILATIAAISATVAAGIAIWVTWGEKIGAFFKGLLQWFHGSFWREQGLSLIKQIGLGMLDAIPGLGTIVRGIAGLISDHFPHSPAKLGPLRDLNRVRIVETIAESMRPAPMLAAIRRVALVTAVAAPMMIGAGMPAMAAGAGAARGVVINYAPQITVNGGGDAAATRRELRKALEADRDNLLKIIDAAMAKRARTEFD